MKRTILSAFVLAATIGFAASAMAADGAAIYKAKCVACHGAEGKGTPMGPGFAGSEYIASTDAAAIAEVITKGRNGAQKNYKNFAMGMPPQKLAEADLNALVEYLKTLSK